MAPGINLDSAVLGDLSPQALIQQHYAAAPDLPLKAVGTGAEPAGIRCGRCHGVLDLCSIMNSSLRGAADMPRSLPI